MQIYYELDLLRFEAWSGGKDTLNTLTYDQTEQLQTILEEAYPDGLEETSLNDILWFERDWIAEMLSFNDWEHLERANAGEEWDEEETKDVLDSDGCWTEYTWYSKDDKHIFIFGDRDVYTPYDTEPDHECDNYEEAQEWFENYKGFEEEE
jgi:hypothetical protein